MGNKYSLRMVLPSILLLVGMVGFSIYVTSNSLPKKDNTSTTITNYYVLHDTLPADVVTYIESRVDRWSRVEKRLNDTKYTIEGDSVTTNAGAYKFVIHPAGGDDIHYVKVTVTNLGNFYSITVAIDNVVQSIAN
jgi:hypothetical protein